MSGNETDDSSANSVGAGMPNSVLVGHGDILFRQRNSFTIIGITTN
jgi:ribosomal protein L27